MDQKTNKSDATPDIQPGDGLILNGLVMAVEVAEKVWEGKSYRQLKAAVTNGVRSFFYTRSDREGPLPEIRPFSRIKVSVTGAYTEKGTVTVRGDVV